jgi:hypothetical protein
MDKQGRVCKNCCRFCAETIECRRTSIFKTVTNPITEWCSEGLWFRPDTNPASNMAWQCVTFLEELDLRRDDPYPLYRVVDTSMFVVPEGKQVTEYGDIEDIPVAVE